MKRGWTIDKQLRIGALLVVVGLLVELFSLFWSHPTAFLVFVAAGGLLLTGGVILYLFVLLRSGSAAPADEDAVGTG